MQSPGFKPLLFQQNQRVPLRLGGEEPAAQEGDDPEGGHERGAEGLLQEGAAEGHRGGGLYKLNPSLPGSLKAPGDPTLAPEM
jgi:hypothetical protein